MIARLRRKLAAHPGRDLVPAGRAGPPHRRPRQQRAVPVHAPGDRPERPATLGAEGARASCAACRSCATSTRDQQNRACRPTLVIDRDTAAPPGISAQADRRHALRRVRPAPGLDHLQAAQPVSRGHGGRARSTGRIPTRCATSTSARPHGHAGPAQRLHALRAAPRPRWPSTTRASSRRSRSRSTWRPGVALGDAVRRDRRRAMHDIGMPRSIHGSFQGTAQAFQARWPTSPS